MWATAQASLRNPITEGLSVINFPAGAHLVCITVRSGGCHACLYFTVMATEAQRETELCRSQVVVVPGRSPLC